MIRRQKAITFILAMAVMFNTLQFGQSIQAETLVTQDDANNVSTPLEGMNPANEEETGGLYISEIYPNDISRSAVYGNSSDHMEYVEIINTTERTISLNDEYELDYEYPSGGNYVLKKLSIAKTDGSTAVSIAPGEVVVLWDQRNDVDSRATEAEFRKSWLIPDHVQVLVVSGQNGFGDTDRGFVLKKLVDGSIVSRFHYTTDVDTTDGLAVHLTIPDSDYMMKVSTANTYGSPGFVYSEQLLEQSAPTNPVNPDGLIITEIRPNDVDRSGFYGMSDDFMECMEVFNTTDQDIDFNKDYEFAYLYKATYYIQPVSTIDNAKLAIEGKTVPNSEGVIIPAHSAAIIWCYRQEALTGYSSFPTTEEFRQAYNLSDDIPVYAQTGQSGWGNNDRGIALLKKNEDGSRTNTSYYFWNGVTDLADDTSVELMISSDGPKMSVYKSQSNTNMGVADAQQYQFNPGSDGGDSEPTDLIAPILTPGVALRTDASSAKVTFVSNEEGTYYYEVVDEGSPAPTLNTEAAGTVCDTTEQTILLTGITAGKKIIYIAVKDAGNNVSQILSMNLDAFEEEAGGLYLTEIFPNDIDRSNVYENTSEHMEYVELTNTTDHVISFNDEYELDYVIPSGETKTFIKLSVNKIDGSSDISIAPGEVVVLWDQRRDLTQYATEEEFRTWWKIPSDIQIFTVSGQPGFASDGRGFAVKKSTTGNIISYYEYVAGDTSDGLAVQLAIPDSGYMMSAFTKNTFGSPGFVYSGQVNKEKTIPGVLKPQGLFITEIRPNDVDRSETYGTSDDYMECVELINTTDSDIDFNKEYEFAYLYKAYFNIQVITTIENAVNNNTSNTEGVIIPAHSSAIIWCYRAASLKNYTSFPTIDDFREAYGISENTPVYAQTGQSGWANTDRGIGLLKKNEDQSRTLTSYFFWNGVTDIKDNKSVDLKITSEGPLMSIYKALSNSNMGIVAEEQYTYALDDGTSPQVSLIEEVNQIRQGEFLRVPYAYSGTQALPIESITLCYKTDDQEAYTEVKETNFAIYNKYYAFIDNATLFDADYVEYYLKVSNAYRTTTTQVQHVDILKEDNYNSLRVNFNQQEALGNENLSGTVEVTAKNYSDESKEIEFKLDGQDVASHQSLERSAYFTFDYNGVDSYFKNGLTHQDQVLYTFARCSEIPTTDSLAIPVSHALMTNNEDGSASIELTIRAGTYGSTWEADTTANNDDFTAGNFKLRLTDGTVLLPETAVDMNQKPIDITAMNKMGDSANCTISITFTFTIPSDKLDAHGFMMDTTTLSDGNHVLEVVTAGEQKQISFNVNNHVVNVPQDKVIQVNVDLKGNNNKVNAALVSNGDDAVSATLYKAVTLNGITYQEGSGDSTASAVKKDSYGKTESDDGNYPYQILEIPINDSSVDSLRVQIKAEDNYDQPVQLYILNTETNAWDIIDNISRENGEITGICQLEKHVDHQMAKVLIQARGAEYMPYTEEDTTSTTKNNDDWDGTKVPEQYDFSIAWMTDTQYYAEQYLTHFTNMTDWIIDNQKELDIQYVVHTGDIVDEFNEEYEFVNASNELKKLEEANIPYGVLAGNHDVAHGNMRYDLYWKYFGADRYQDSQVYGGTYKNNLGHYDLMTVNGEELIFIYMSWDIYYPESDWINAVLAEYPDRKAVICVHGGINSAGIQSYASDFLLENVCKNNDNVFAIINGHFHGSSLNFVGFDDNGDGTDDRAVYQICTDYQSAPEGGTGYIKMIYFDFANDKIYLNSYSPSINDFNYYDTPKLDNYGIGTLQDNIDITELSLDFDRDSTKTLDISAVSVTGLTSTRIGQANCTAGSTSVDINTSLISGNTVKAYAVLQDDNGEIVGYSKVVDLPLSGPSTPSQGGSGSNDDGDIQDIPDSQQPLSDGSDADQYIATIPVKADDQGTISTKISQAEAEKMVKEALGTDSTARELVLKLNASDNKPINNVQVTFPSSVLKTFADRSDASFTIDTGIAMVTFDGAAADSISASTTEELTLNVEKVDTSTLSKEIADQVGDHPVYDFTLSTGGKPISTFGKGYVHISLPYTPSGNENLNAIVVYYIADDGTLETVMGHYNEVTGMVEITVGHFSKYAVGYNLVTYKDVDRQAWYYEAVTFIAARGITSGTNGNTYEPERRITRGAFMVLLMNAYGIKPDTIIHDNFKDAGNTYYTNYLATAKRLGIATGIGDNQFAPESQLSRQDMITLLYRALEALGRLPKSNTSSKLNDFADVGSISIYAKEGMELFLRAGIINGNNHALDPKGIATRAQIAQILYKLLTK